MPSSDSCRHGAHALLPVSCGSVPFNCKACESCHLEYWYPGDKKAVLESQQNKVTYDKPRK